MARDTVLDDDGSSDQNPADGVSDGNDSILGRRGYLGLVGSAAAAVTMSGVGAAAEDYDVIEVGAGQTRTVRLSDGESFSNVLIDITAPNAKFHIRAIADNWEIRNVGFRGNWDSTAKEDAIICQVNSPNASGLIENVYFMGNENDNSYPGITGINVANGHAGDLEIRNVNIQNCPDNSIYASNPGDSSRHPSGSGGGGPVVIKDSYARNSRAAGFRVGTDGSIVENCVAVDCDKGFWGYYEHTAVKDCDISGSAHADVRCGAPDWVKGQNAEVTVTNTRYETDDNRGAAIHGSSSGTPQRTEPSEVEGVPLSAEEAASGSSGSGRRDDGSNEDDKDESGNEEPADGHLLSFVTEPDARYAGYEFTADGPVGFAEVPDPTPSGGRIEGGTYTSEDFVEETDDGWHAGGVTGGGHGDAFRVDGTITSIEVGQPDVMWVELDGERLDPDEIIEQTGGEPDDDDTDEGDDGDESDEPDEPDEPSDELTNVIVIDACDTSRETTFSFDVTGEVRHTPYLGSQSGSISGSTVSGTIANACDAYEFSGDIENFRLAGNANVSVEYDAL
ncbi:hypothetical protein C482_10331 [Natrialba chahannaoensis JCM 10990]|uniref:Right handed beta helix domain-containing protein n=1 Tax=Natrialba chahannaoensis JCM 10990 TaxID=1227492 RepID=M0ALK3_9EURY|nr:hypothetical protein [Natrialba chahannaoensis]ELY99419.1 hypothetical protein C482_10331 [Natrialba chahannaoensis JCM 10990]